MNTAATERRNVPGPNNRWSAPAKAPEPSTREAIREAVVVGCGASVCHAMIEEAAYYRAERRGFQPGHELEDWLAAEGEIKGLWTRCLEEGPLACSN